MAIVLGAFACTASASEGRDAPLAQASKKKACKKKGAKKKKCKTPAGGPAEAPLSVTITGCPTGSVSGSSVATISGTASVGPQVTTYINFGRADDYFGTIVREEVRVYPSANGAWSYSFTPGFPEGWVSTSSWDQRVVASNYRAHDGVDAECSWIVTR